MVRRSAMQKDFHLLKRETDIHIMLDHDFIVKCFDIQQDAEHCYIVLEYCPNGTLKESVER